MTYLCTRYEIMMGMLRSSTAIGFSWWPPLRVMPCPWEEASLLQKVEIDWEMWASPKHQIMWCLLVHLSRTYSIGVESEVPENKVDEALTQCLARHVSLGWVDGILWPLPSVAP